MFEAKADIGIGGEVKDKIASGDRTGQRREVKVVALDKLESGVFAGTDKEFILAGGKIVPADDVFAAGQQAVNKVAANETGSTGDKNLFHDRARSLVRRGWGRQHF